jgi:hypothetical protein
MKTRLRLWPTQSARRVCLDALQLYNGFHNILVPVSLGRRVRRILRLLRREVFKLRISYIGEVLSWSVRLLRTFVYPSTLLLAIACHNPQHILDHLPEKVAEKDEKNDPESVHPSHLPMPERVVVFNRRPVLPENLPHQFLILCRVRNKVELGGIHDQ